MGLQQHETSVLGRFICGRYRSVQAGSRGSTRETSAVEILCSRLSTSSYVGLRKRLGGLWAVSLFD